MTTLSPDGAAGSVVTRRRLAFMGTPAFAVSTLDALVTAGHHVAAVYCQPPRPAGRGYRLQPSPVQSAAERLGIAVRTPRSLRDEAAQAEFAALDVDAAIVAAYGLILPPAILSAPRCGCLNVHASLLPRWRGAAPIERAILAGDAESGITIMQMEAGLDTGPILLADPVPIGPRMTAQELSAALAALGARLVVDAIAMLDRLQPVPQPEDGVTYAAKLTNEEGLLDWRQPARHLDAQVRALGQRPGTWFTWGDERIRVLAAEPQERPGAVPGTVLDDRLTIACGEGALRLDRIQRPGRGPLDTAVFLRGLAIPAGTRLPTP